MYVRHQAGSTLLIRTKYDATIGRGTQSVFAKFKDATTAPADVRALCTSAELAQLDDYLATKLAVVTAQEHQLSLQIGHRSIDRITDAVASLSAETNAEKIATQLWASSLKLQKALKTAGFPRPVKPAKAPVVNEAQPELSV